MSQTPLQATLHTVIFGTDTRAGKNFDIVLIVCILLSVAVMLLETVSGVAERYGSELKALEWFFTILFTIEYGTRIYCSLHRWQYVRSFYGVVDLLAILPTYLALFLTGFEYLLMVRLLRVMRIFRVFKLMRYLREANVLMRAIVQSRRKVGVFFLAVLVVATIFGSLMYVIEGPENGFTSIPKSVYWTIVTITTVGYGDITPQTSLGQFIAATTMLIGYANIAVPTGILTAELASEIQRERASVVCQNCFAVGHESDAAFCKFCGHKIQ